MTVSMGAVTYVTPPPSVRDRDDSAQARRPVSQQRLQNDAGHATSLPVVLDGDRYIRLVRPVPVSDEPPDSHRLLSGPHRKFAGS